jgi:hypothetical protein
VKPLTDLWTRLRTAWAPPPESVEEPDGSKLIQEFSILVVCTCPCGSTMPHQLSLTSTADCRRCGRTIGVRSITYVRRGPGVIPRPEVTVGYVLTPQALRARRTVGIH